MLANIRLAEPLLDQCDVANAVARDRDKQIVVFYLSTIALGTSGRRNMLEVVETETTVPNVLATNEQSTVFGIELCPATRAAGDKVGQLTKLHHRPILRNHPHLGLLVTRPHRASPPSLRIFI
jgi:hypothetical protein